MKLLFCLFFEWTLSYKNSTQSILKIFIVRQHSIVLILHWQTFWHPFLIVLTLIVIFKSIDLLNYLIHSLIVSIINLQMMSKPFSSNFPPHRLDIKPTQFILFLSRNIKSPIDSEQQLQFNYWNDWSVISNYSRKVSFFKFIFALFVFFFKWRYWPYITWVWSWWLLFFNFF